jgi:hypothetical protein
MLEVVVLVWLSFDLFLDDFFLASFLGVVGVFSAVLWVSG